MKFISFCICALLYAPLLWGQTSPFSNVLKYYEQEKQFNGTVLVATHGKANFVGRAGKGDRNAGTAIQLDSKFKIASLTKTFTAVLILQLYEAGKLDLNQTIGHYLPNYKGEAKDKATVHHLLTYSSGIPNCEGNTGIAVYQTPISTQAFVDQYCSGPLMFTPGTQFSYNNGDYILLGQIIEQLSGTTFAQYLEKRILQPCKMKNTDLLASKDIVPGLVPTYNLDDSTQTFYADDPMYIEHYYAAGAMYSTVKDLLKFDSALFHYKLLSKTTLDLMLKPHPELYNVAYGFWVTDNQYGKVKAQTADRQGSIWGANAQWLHLLDQDKTILILSNTNATNLHELAEQLVLVSTGQAATVPVKAKPKPQPSKKPRKG